MTTSSQKFDDLRKKILPLQKKYAKAATKEAVKIFGPKFASDMTTRLAVMESLNPRFDIILEIVRTEI